ncbi:MAG TPA: tetratricopeptide repeat protein, partial [Povalibacter sp.]|nr:tetratricopeptide repeat protein [Povalibacter sp.]
MNIEAQLAHAWKLVQQGQIGAARDLCASVVRANPGHAPAVHLAGLIEKRLGNLDGAEERLRRSVVLSPGVAEFHVNLGNLLAERGAWDDAAREYAAAAALEPAARPARRRLAEALARAGQGVAAEREARTLVAGDTGDTAARVLLGDVLRMSQRHAEAEQVYRDVLAATPGEGRAHHNLGALLSQLHRPEEALTQLQAATSAGITGAQLDHNLGQTLLQLGQLQAAQGAFAAALRRDPHNVDTLAMLARVRFLLGDADFTGHIHHAADQRPDLVHLRVLHGTLQWRAGNLSQAENALRTALDRDPHNCAAHATLAYVLLDTGQVEHALAASERAWSLEPTDNLACDARVSALLSSGDAHSALTIIEQCRRRWPLDQRWLAHLATASRLTDAVAYRELYDYSRFVRCYSLDAPPGWASQHEFLAALADVLHSRHTGSIAPLDQSLRRGTQTTRSLLTDPAPVVQALLATLREPLRDYCSRLSSTDHPFTQRNRGDVEFTGCWSVRLQGGGYHVNHVHPQGWISSACYISIPAGVSAGSDHAGWIRFGEP